MLKNEVIKKLESIGIKVSKDKLEIPRPELGDIAFPCFELARKKKRSPQEIAEEISNKIKLPKDSLVAKVEAKSGYVNFFFDWKRISEKILKNIQKTKVDVGKKKKIMVEYVSANPIHPLHVGVLRNAVIGNSLVKILEATNHKVLSHFYVNDMGLQTTRVVYGFLNLKEKPKEKIDHFFGKIYAITDRFLEKDEEVLKELKDKWPDIFEKLVKILEKKKNAKEEAQELMQKCEAGDKETINKFRKVTEQCLEGFKETLKNLDISFDSFDFESEFVTNLSVYNIVEELKKRKLLKESEEKTWFLDLEKFGLPSLVLVRSDGTTLYSTRDIAYSIWKFKNFGVEKVINVIGMEQTLVQSQLKAMLKLLGYDKESENLIHYSYNHVRLPGVKISGRRGRYITIDELLEKAFEKALKEVEKRNPKLVKGEKEKIAKDVAKAAIKYAILRIEPEKEINFNLENALSFEGDTGPYLQYAHTRCLGILKKAKKWKPNFKPEKLKAEEKNLIKVLIRFPEVLEQAAKDLRPHYICNNAYELATTFSNFYQSCPVLKAEEKIRNFRLALVLTTAQILKNSLSLIGIEVPEKM